MPAHLPLRVLLVSAALCGSAAPALAQTYLLEPPMPYGPRYIKNWNEGQPIPAGYHEETRVRKGPVIAGAVLLGVTYIYTAFFASLTADFENEQNGTGTSHSNPASELYIPVLGPFMEVSHTNLETLKYLLILDGVAQASGATMFLYGIVAQRAILVRNDVFAMVTVTPMRLGQDGSGFGFVGRF